jgi:HEPN domain-containing protein
MNRNLERLDQAQRDLKKAEIDLQHAYWEWACFTAQQAAEKSVKSLLVYQGHDVWGHAITPMLRRLETPDAPIVFNVNETFYSSFQPSRAMCHILLE